MSGTVDDRIVGLKFDNKGFESGAQTTLSTLQKLKENMNFSNATSVAGKALGGFSSFLGRFSALNPFRGATTGAAELQTAANRVSMQPLETSIAGVSKSFLAMSTIAVTALSNITNKAINVGSNITKSLTVDPVKTGLEEYETNLNSIQTILANTKVSGANLDDVNHALDELNHYSDKTIYNFSEMARNIGTFTAAGVDLDTATSSIKGIANLAALSGSNSQQASTAMYQLSQEIAAGRVSLMGWNSVVNAGMGGSTFQRALVQTAETMGTLEGKTVEFTGKMKNATIDGKSFRDSIMAKPGEVSWLTSDVLTKTLNQFTNDMSDAELAAQGFSKAQIKAIQDQAKTAENAATKVKTLSGVLDTAKEVAASGWSQTWRTIFGDFKEARKTFTALSNTVNDFLGDMADARNDLLDGWKEMGGREVAIEGLKNAFDALKSVLDPIRDAFRAIFPKQTSEGLYELTERFRDFTEGLAISEGTAKLVKRTFKGVFAIFDIAGQVIGGVAGMFKDLFAAAGDNAGGVLRFTADLGKNLAKFSEALRESGAITSFFSGLGEIIKVPLALLGAFAEVLGNLFFGADLEGGAQKIGDAMGKVNERLKPLESVGQRVSDIFGKIGEVFSKVGEVIGTALSGIGDAIAKAFTPDTFDKSLDVINTGLLTALVLMIKSFFNNGLKLDLTGGLFDSVTETLGAVTGTLENMQASIKADIIMKIAISLAILAASIAVLSMIDPKKLQSSLVAMTVGFAGLQIALVSLSKFIGYLGMAKLPFIAAALIGVATAMLILATALKVMSTMSPAELARAMVAFAGSMYILTKAMKAMSKDTKGVIRAAAAMTLLGVAMNLMAVALKIFATMSWDDIAHGMTALAGTLGALIIGMRLMPKDIFKQAAALAVLGAALNGMAVALKIFGSMSWESMAKGLLAMAGSLVIIAGAMRIMPKDMLLQSVALNAVASALVILSLALMSMGNMGWEQIGKGLVVLAGSLLILAGALYLMNGSLAGSAALVIAAGALQLLVPTLIILGSLNWETIIKGLVALAGIFTVLGVAGYLLGPLVPVILGLGASMVLLGAGLALAGAGALAMATAFGIVVATGAAGIQVLADLLGTFIAAIPEAMKAFGQGVVEFGNVIANNAGTFFKAFSNILSSILDAIIKNTPKIGQAFMALLKTALRVIVQGAPMIFNAGLRLIVGFLQAIDQNIGKIVPLAISIVTKFIDGVANNIGKIIESGVNLIIKFIEGITDAINNNSERVGRAGGELAVAIVQGMVNGIKGGISAVTDAAMDLAKGALNAAKDFLGIKSPSREFVKIGKYLTEGFAIGIVGGQQHVIDTMKALTDQIKEIGSNASATIEEETAKLKDLKKAKREVEKDKNKKNDDKYDKDIKKAEKAIKMAEKEKEAAAKARGKMKKALADEQQQLKDLGKEYDQLAVDLEKAEQNLQDVTNYRNQIRDQYNQPQDIQRNTSLQGYLNNTAKQTAKVTEFNADLQTLLSMGLDQSSYEQLLAEGLDAQPFINKLIAAGPEMVAAFDSANAGLTAAATAMGDNATQQMYGTGVQAAQGLVDGIKARQGEIEATMAEIGEKMATAIKKALKIKSPSRVFMEVGKYSNEGLVKGLKTYSGAVDNAAAGVGLSALDTLRHSMKKVSQAVPTDVDMAPRVAPVLDLTRLQKEATKISGMLPEATVMGQVTFDEANAVAAEMPRPGEGPGSGPTGGGDTINYEQNIYTNESPSEIAVYRGTRNQLSMKKEELKLK